MEHLKQAYDFGLFQAWWIEVYGLERGTYGSYNGIRNQVGFVETMLRIRERNAEALARIRTELPEVFEIGPTEG